MNKFRAAVFGKQGCDKCDLLKRRLGKILQDKAYEDFEMEYLDLGTVEGLIRFSLCEVLNPQRIPSLFVYRVVEQDNGTVLKPLKQLIEVSALDGPDSEIETFLYLETDYRATGVITPNDIRKVLDKATATVTAGTAK